ncbi:hypothetical protein J6590_051815 [Homalodisca vitripennis]|nr:hypothetical protein J6590_051815 [Homalodisca vitripennis]
MKENRVDEGRPSADCCVSVNGVDGWLVGGGGGTYSTAVQCTCLSPVLMLMFVLDSETWLPLASSSP